MILQVLPRLAGGAYGLCPEGDYVSRSGCMFGEHLYDLSTVSVLNRESFGYDKV